jgi:3-methyladenine DNA glycosylase/8-oxoguanine DNA glycosylase
MSVAAPAASFPQPRGPVSHERVPAGDLTRRHQFAASYDLHASVGVLRHGPHDPTYHVAPDGSVWRACRTPAGTATLRLAENLADTEGTLVEARAWGEGAAWLLDGLPDLLGAHDTPEAVDPLVAEHPMLRDSARRHRGWRVIRSRSVIESLVPAVLEQKVTAIEAYRSFRTLVNRYGEPAPGPTPPGAARQLRCPPSPRGWCRVPSWEWHRAGVDDRRARAVIAACRVATRLERTVDLPHDEAERLLRVVPGIGVWTAAEIRQRAHGDPDALSVGDFHLAPSVGYALAGERDADDARMLELLEPYRGQRYRVARLALLGGPRRPRRGPRMAPRDFRTF